MHHVDMHELVLGQALLRAQCSTLRSCFMQAMYPGNMAFQPAAPKYDWGLLVVLLAIEMDKKDWTQLYNNTEPRKMNLQRVQQKCKSDHQDLQALFDELVAAAGWENA